MNHPRSIRGLVAVTAAIFALQGCVSVDGGIANRSKVPLQGSREYDLFVLPLLVDDLKAVHPLGALNPSHHTFPTGHQYLILAKPHRRSPVFMPTDGTVVHLMAMENISDGFTDYAVRFRVREGLVGMMGHLSTISGSLESALEDAVVQKLQEYETGGKQFAVRFYNLNVQISGGEKIGTAGANPDQGALDIGLYDDSVVHDFADISRFDDSQYVHAVSLLDYYDEELRAVLASLSLRSVEPIGGQLCYDVAGSAQGIWFLPGSPTYPEDPHIALVLDEEDPTVAVFSVGRSVPGLEPGQYAFTPTADGSRTKINAAFDSVREDGTLYVYRDLRSRDGQLSGEILVELLDSQHIRIEYKRSAGGGTPEFSQNAAIFER